MKKRLLFVLLIIFSLILSACTEGTSGNEETSNENKSLTVALAAEPTTLLGSMDPAANTSGIIRNIYDRLIDYDGEGNFIPKLAIEWKNIDEYTWEYKLREGVTFHNGAKFNAESVKFTVDFMTNPDNKSVYGGRWIKDLKEVKVIDEYTIQFITTRPIANFLFKTVTDFQILEPSYVNEVGAEEASQKPIGTGPYKFVKWERGESLEFEANNDYWGGKPNIQNFTVKIVPEFSSRLSALLSGEVDLIKSVPVDSIDRVEADQNNKIITGLTGKPS